MQGRWRSRICGLICRVNRRRPLSLWTFTIVQPETMRRCFSTLGCAELTLPEICALAGEFHVPAVELRGIGGRMDMPEYCASSGLTPQSVSELCRKQGT